MQRRPDSLFRPPSLTGPLDEQGGYIGQWMSYTFGRTIGTNLAKFAMRAVGAILFLLFIAICELIR